MASTTVVSGPLSTGVITMALGATLPMLYRQYTDLCEPGGARFLAFGVDPAFSNSVDGLIEVDMHCLRPKKRERYLVERAFEQRKDAVEVKQ